VPGADSLLNSYDNGLLGLASEKPQLVQDGEEENSGLL